MVNGSCGGGNAISGDHAGSGITGQHENAGNAKELPVCLGKPALHNFVASFPSEQVLDPFCCLGIPP